MIKISIVMPVYNTGIYLTEALKSIFAQKFKEFELICVDDASNDALTKKILQNYEKKHKNMQIIKQEKHVGAAQARNIGFSQVRGKYVIFLDADDIFAKDLLERMYKCISENDADVCLCGFEMFYLENGGRKIVNVYIPDDVKVFCKNREDWLIDISPVPWNKLCKVHFLKEADIYFQSLPSCNDTFFSCMTMMHAKKSCFVNGAPLVFYRMNTSVQISADRDPMNLYKSVIYLKDEEEKRSGKSAFLSQWIDAFFLWHGVVELKRSHDTVKQKKFYDLMGRFFSDHVVSFQNAILKTYLANLRGLPFESKWFSDDDVEVFLGQLRLGSKELIKILDGEKALYLWGLGKRGKAFQHFCKEQNINLQGIADIKNTNIGNLTEYGNRIIRTQDVLEDCGLVIASNHKIYEYLDKNYLNMKTLNLEKYCPGNVFDSTLK